MNFAKYRVQLSTEKKYSSKYEYKYEYEYSIPETKTEYWQCSFLFNCSTNSPAVMPPEKYSLPISYTSQVLVRGDNSIQFLAMFGE